MARKTEPWTPNEEHILRTKYATHTAQEIHDKYLPNRTPDGIRGHAIVMGLSQSRPHADSHPWTDRELELLKTYYPGMKVADFQKAHMPHRTTGSITSKARDLGCVHKRAKSQAAGTKGKRRTAAIWSDGETEILRTHYAAATMDELRAKLPGKTAKQIQSKAYAENLTRPYGWTDKEIGILKDNAAGMTAKELCELLPNQNVGTIYPMAKRLGLELKRSHAESEHGRKKWTPAELEILEKHGDEPIEELRKRLPDRSVGAIQTKLSKKKGNDDT